MERSKVQDDITRYRKNLPHDIFKICFKFSEIFNFQVFAHLIMWLLLLYFTGENLGVSSNALFPFRSKKLDTILAQGRHFNSYYYSTIIKR